MIAARTLTDGGQGATEVARLVAGFVAEARLTLDLAHYHLELSPEPARIVRDAITDAAARGVAVRIVYNLDFRGPIPVPPPPNTDDDLIQSMGVPARAISGVPDLMHHKYVVRDGKAVWTGSANWTDDSWQREENVIVVAESPALAAAYTTDFEQLWTTRAVAESGCVSSAPIDVGAVTVRPWFSPGNGSAMSARIGRALARARRRIRICSPIVTEGGILGTLAQVASDGKVDLAGVVDVTQVRGVVNQWRFNGNAAWKIPALERVFAAAPFSGKPSTPWSEESVHDFMHAKITVADDVVFTGSYNLSHSGEENSENVLEIHDPALAEQLATYADDVRRLYPPVALEE